VATDLTWFVDNLAGSHEFKGGVQYSGTDFLAANCATGTTGGACSPGSLGYTYWDVNWFGPDTPLFMDENYTAGTQAYDGTLYTAFVQDAWRVLPNLTLKLGVRYDQVSYDNNAGEQIADMTKLQPRIGGAWDVTGDAKNLIRFNWGRFMHPSALILPYVIRDANEPYFSYYSCSTYVNYIWGVPVGSAEECEAFANAYGLGYNPGYDGSDPLGWVLHPAEVYGLEGSAVDPNLDPTYADTLSIGYEREVGNRASIEITYVDKKTRDILEDTCGGNLGPDGPTEGASCDSYVVTNLSEAKRDYQGVMLTFETRTYSWLTLIASYTYSESKGSVGFSQYQNSDFDVYPWHFDNRYGFLDDHRQHRFKLNGFVLLPYDFTISFDGFYSSAFAWEPREDEVDNPDIPYGEYFLEPRGSRDAFDAYRLDLQLSKGFTIANRVRMVLIGTVYNTFSTEYGTSVCDSPRGCGDYEMGEATTWSRPRRYELGFRIEF
jgi:outer membrane receptor protein involved in Fe transport